MPKSWFLRFGLITGLLFLYIPIILLIVLSFNDNRSVSVWSEFSFRWYGELMRDDQLLSAAWLSVRVAFISASFAVVLGTLAGMMLARFGAFKGRALFSGMVSAPLVMPEVIMGLSLLLLFVSMEQVLGWPEGRGMLTIILAHITFTMSFVTVVVQSRLVSMDASLEEAAMDLGARPAKVFFVITLPLIAPAIVSGWLLAFTLSLDDLVITSFVSGPGSTTLPQIVFSSVRLGLSPKVNALATIVVTIVAIGIICAGIYNARQEKARQRDEQMAQQGG
ncbi:spermidine/putrescine ABC transporter permease [alpha proteobacterium AAP38]|jgi:putrescine transport system permease protein|uniref:Putrescine ABC transporter permease PotI n=1 Tax=Niveispirillum cyanobacteriorum TaxID=1612173 RepID=A0A2K9N9H8_9PROT|nr:ABC transporter permease subunit [Niveispirillum cyanobacteriorum]AUN29778.1 putrescine ABC transporter permease PotI [Niveispirillum cyanobacteriorum]KPF86278.1 spermidine/putrescine ABC transporter permease [alpha proteobacterium AAP38]MBJ7413921.1 ABC transporter permease subunit [Niveispirillum sp.]GGE60819.1 putrescine ABC transporter permease PotI [Niveispirillum cyanobacteriorum]